MPRGWVFQLIDHMCKNPFVKILMSATVCIIQHIRKVAKDNTYVLYRRVQHTPKKHKIKV